jgi:GNAT superfamily N-acetyltransferase
MEEQDLQVRKLKGKDVSAGKEMDEASGFYVAQWLEDLESDEEASDAYGLFLDGELIGYCTLGYADGLDITTDYDSRLLSDVYVKPEYRHLGYGSKIVSEALQQETDCRYHDTYLTYLHDRLEDFYKPLGFVHAEGTDNVMMKPVELELARNDETNELEI